MKNFLKNNLLGLVALLAIFFMYATPMRTRIGNDVVMKRTLIVNSLNERACDTSTWFQIGNADSSRRAAMLIWWTDTATVGARKKNGLIIYNRVDSSLWYYNSRRWKKVGT